MHNKNLLASLALFSELYNSNKYKGLPEIIADFILNVVRLENCYQCNSIELKGFLKSHYGFDIPESVIRTTVRRLVKSKKATINNREFYFLPESENNSSSQVQVQIEDIINKQEELFEKLCLFIEKKTNSKIQDKSKVFRSFLHFLLESNGASEAYMDVISAFFISDEIDESTQDIITSIKEGVVLYQGITTTANITEFGKWKSDLTIYLATEHLFNAVGYNGLLYNNIFDDFLSLVNDINRISKEKNKKIELYFLEETEQEINRYFEAAENILRSGSRVNQQIAMKTILNGCSTPADIKAKKIRFFDNLRKKGITCVPVSKELENIVPEYNIECLEGLEQAEFFSKNINEEESLNLLRLFTIVNTKRRGKNNVPFERIRYIYMTDSSLAGFLAHNSVVKMQKGDFPFAKNIDFFITQFWYKLNKGFNSPTHLLPKSFEAITKAKIVLSSYVGNSLVKRYDEINKKYENKELTKEEVSLMIQEMRSKPQTPDEISKENITETLEFLQDDFVERVCRENSLRKQRLEENAKEIEDKNKIIKDKEQELEKYRAKEEANRIADEAKDYANKEWRKKKKENIKDAIYFTIWLIVDIGILIFVLYGDILNIFEKLFKTIFYNWIVIPLAVFFLLFKYSCKWNRERFFSGLHFICNCWRYRAYKEECILKFEEEYKSNSL